MRKTITTVLLLVAVIVILTGVTGCSFGKTYGLAAPGLTKEEVNQRHLEAIRTDNWQLQDDIDAFFLFDRPGRMHRLIVR
ncbi:MAG: hypothetical protein OEV87_09475 [Phycisphaerae bacterium]|nr:hypothetical protein [Phycisphaerae bacterium]